MKNMNTYRIYDNIKNDHSLFLRYQNGTVIMFYKKESLSFRGTS